MVFFCNVYLLSPSDYYRILDESQTLRNLSPTTLTPESSSNDAGMSNSTKHFCFGFTQAASIGLDDSPTAKHLFSRRSSSQVSRTKRRSSKYLDLNWTFTTLICVLYLEI
jgi:hypothetical protein